MFKKLFDQLKRIKGNDIFISYSRADSLDYALALANTLSSKQYYCYLDQYHNHPGEQIPEELINALRSCSAMVLLLSPKALESKFMVQEVIEFQKTKRLIIPIKIDSVPDIGDYSNLLAGIAITIEEQSAWESRKPSVKIVDRIIGSFIYRKRIKVLRDISVVTFALIIAGISVGVIYSGKLTSEIKGLETRKDDLETEKRKLGDSINVQKDSIAKSKENIDSLNGNILVLNDSLISSRDLMTDLDKTSKNLYASNLIGLMKKDELDRNNFASRSFNPFSINRRMLLALESYKINHNADAENLLNEGIDFFGEKILDKSFNGNKVKDIAVTKANFTENYLAVLLENGDILISEANKKTKFTVSTSIPDAYSIFFLNKEELLVLKNGTSSCDVITYNHKTKEKKSFTIPMICKKADFDDSGKLGFFLGVDGKFICYKWEDKSKLLEQNDILQFGINKETSNVGLYDDRITDKVVLWIGDYVCTYDLPNFDQKNKIYLENNVFSKMIYSETGNFVASGDNFKEVRQSGLINEIYFENKAKQTTQHFRYITSMGNVGFYNDQIIFFSSEKAHENAIHFLEMYSFDTNIKEKLRILHNTEFIKLCYDGFQNTLYAIDLKGHLIGWDTHPLTYDYRKSDLKGEQLTHEVCKRLLSNFTKAEWDFYFKDKPYCKTCPELK